jgi:valyl-tRNA synthetase
VEAAKIGLYGEDEDEKNRTATLLIHVLKESLKLLHPFLPFITEEIWGKLPGNDEPLIVTAYPEADTDLEDESAEAVFGIMQELVTGIRTLRSEFTVPPSKQVKVRVEAAGDTADALEQTLDIAAMLVRSDDFSLMTADESLEGSLAVVGRGFTAHVFIRDLIDVDAAIKRFRKSLDKTVKLIEAKKKKLSNENFVSRAPETIINKEKASLAEMEDTVERSTAYLAALES